MKKREIRLYVKEEYWRDVNNHIFKDEKEKKKVEKGNERKRGDSEETGKKRIKRKYIRKELKRKLKGRRDNDKKGKKE